MVADGRLRGVRVGRLWRVHPDELDRYVYEASRGGDDD
jgi:excisionase family DNA binding protein